MNNLLIDIGNSDVKIGTGNQKSGNVKLLKRFSYSKNNFENDLKKGFGEISSTGNINKVGVSVLNSNGKKFLTDIFGHNTVFISRDLKLPVRIEYSKGLGNDRICSAAAASAAYPNKNILVIDLGTATTFTVISANAIKGGMIAPGIKTSLLCLTVRTSLPDVDLKFPKDLLNKNTKDNIRSGILYSALYSVERTISETKKKYPGLLVIATGGFAGLISKRTKLINNTDVNLVMRGINIILSQ